MQWTEDDSSIQFEVVRRSMQWTEGESSIQFEVVSRSMQLNRVERIVRLKALWLRTRCKVVGSNPLYQLPTARALVASGKAVALAVTTSTRTELWPELPTVAESGLPGYSSSAWFGLFAPAATPKIVLDKLSLAVREIMVMPTTKDWLRNQGTIGVGDTQEEFREKIVEDIKRWTNLVQSSGIKFE